MEGLTTRVVEAACSLLSRLSVRCCVASGRYSARAAYGPVACKRRFGEHVQCRGVAGLGEGDKKGVPDKVRTGGDLR